MDVKYDSYVISKYGDNVKFTKENAKDIYLLTDCNGFRDNKFTNWLLKHYEIEEILKWNDEFIFNELKKCESNLKKDYDSIRKVNSRLSIIIGTYSTNKEAYVKIIEFIKKYNQISGYFTYYSFLDPKDPDSHEFTSYNYKILYERREFSSKRRFEYIQANKSTSKEDFYNDYKYGGLISRLYYLGFYDLLDDFLDNVMLEVFKHFREDNEIMKENNLVYLGDWINKNVFGDQNLLCLKRFIEDVKYPISEELNEYLKIS